MRKEIQPYIEENDRKMYANNIYIFFATDLKNNRK